MIRVRAPSRLHFGLLHLASKEFCPEKGVGSFPARKNAAKSDSPKLPTPFSGRQVPERLFGGVGLMIEDPGVQLTVASSATWAAQGPLADRVIQTIERVKQGLAPVALVPQLLTVERAAPEHAGLGTGTQLALAAARGLTVAAGLEALGAPELARLAGRGLRSALGVHGFAQGGFLVEGGKRQLDRVSPLVARLPFPEPWRILVILPPVGPGLHGLDEHRAFEQLQEQPVPSATTDVLCRLVLLVMLPALAEQDWPAFSEALYEFNVLVGETFASVQGGIYASPAIGDLVRWLRDQGLPGAGQSSWGPAVFAIAQDEGQAKSVATRLRGRFALPADALLVTRACNTGGTIQQTR